MNKFRFSYLARRLAMLAGRPATFFAAVAAIVLWALSGPVFGYSDTWQLVVNTATTIISAARPDSPEIKDLRLARTPPATTP
jgi:low affinity Fe/Cu permease